MKASPLLCSFVLIFPNLSSVRLKRGHFRVRVRVDGERVFVISLLVGYKNDNTDK